MSKARKKSRKKEASSDDDDEIAEKETQLLSPYEHIRTKDKDTGPKEPKEVMLPLWDEDVKRFQWTTVSISVAMMTMIDEVIVNAGDHNTNYPDKVTDVDIGFDEKTGEISIRNNGPGIPIYEVWIRKDEKTSKPIPIKVETMKPSLGADDRKKHVADIFWNPQVIATHTLAGTNLQKRKDHRTGGTNGIGLKCTVYQSRSFRLVTVDENRKIKYDQSYEGRTDYLEIHPPKITQYYNADSPEVADGQRIWDPAKFAPYTRMQFIPEYTLFGGDEYNAKKHGFLVREYLRMRAYQLQVYTGMRVRFMDELIDVENLEQYALLHTEPPRNDHEKELPRVARCIMEYKGPELEAIKYKWEVAIIANLTSDQHHITMVNSIYPYEGGTHVDYMLNMLVQHLFDIIRKELGKSVDDMKELNRGGSLTKLIKSQISIFAKCPINNPAWSGQIKARIMTPEKTFGELYQFPHNMYRNIWRVVESYIKYQWLSKDALLKQHNRVNRKKLDYDGYKPASNAGKKGKSHLTRLFIPEGKSAAGLVDKGLSSSEIPDLTYENYGYYNIQGVPMNARRAYQSITNPESGEEFKICKDKLSDNERFRALVEILGLDFHKKYEGDDEMDSLRYGGVILAVDQDEDGKGNIATLILNIFSVFWPHLIKRGFIQILRTPIVTVRVKSGRSEAKVKEFYTTMEYDKWLTDTYPDGLPSGSVVKYHKGLACNSTAESLRILKRIDKNLSMFKWDRKAEPHFEIYYGADSSKRKKMLSTPVDWTIVDADATEKTCTMVLNTDTKAFQQYNVNRKIPNVYDGFLDGRRKIYTRARDYFAVKSRIANVNSFGGAVKDMYDYQHGESSLNGSIIKMGQEYVGGMNVPMLKGNVISGFGSRKMGGKDAGAPRYLSTKLNHGPSDAIFPADDDYLLTQQESGEPKYFVPIVPYAILQSDMHIPAHGWKVKLFAVDPFACINLVRSCINGIVDVDDVDDIPMLPICTLRWQGKIVCYRGQLYSCGTYEWDSKNNTITITELPHGVFSDLFVFGDRKKERRKREKWKIKQQQQSSHNKELMEQQQLKKYRKGLKSKRHGREYDDIRNDTDSEPDDGDDADSSDEDEDGNHDGGNNNHSKRKSSSRGDSEYRSRTIKDKPFVENIVDASEDHQIRIIITLAEGGYERILEEYHKAQNEEPDDSADDSANDSADNSDDNSGDEKERTVRYGGKDIRIPPGVNKIDNFDPIEEYFLLRRSLAHQLNFLNKDGVVQHYSSYEEVFAEWYHERRTLYGKRIERQIILLRFLIIELENIIRYSKEYDDLNMSKKSTEDVIEILAEKKFTSLNTKLLHNPKYTSVEDLERLITDPKHVSYDYLINMRFRDTHKDVIEKKMAALEKLRADLESKINDTKDHNGIFTGAITWQSELDTLRDVLDKGFRLGWGYDELKDIYADDSSSDSDDDKPNSKTKSKSKSKSNGKAKSKPSGKAKPKPKPKSKSKPNGKAKSKSKPNGKAKPKSKSNGKAKK